MPSAGQVAVKAASLLEIRDKIYEEKRLEPEEALLLLREEDLTLLGSLADLVRRRLHPEGVVTFVIDRNVNYTNVCVSGCKFCAFHRRKNDRDAYVLEVEELLDKVAELLEWGGTTLLMQGGINPELPLSFYERMISAVRARFPEIQIHCFSAPEIVFLARREGLSIREVLLRLKEAGLMSVPGGGAEILSEEVRREISPGKCSVEEWEEVHRIAHSLGMPTTATMMFGHVEGDGHIIEHLERIRRIQDETGGFTAFIPWTFQKGNTRLDHVSPAGSARYLRILALSRLYLDNFRNIQSSHVTQTLRVGTVGLHFGANDLGSVMIEENVVSSTSFRVHIPGVEEMVKAIKEAGFRPAQRDTYYKIVRFW